MVTSDPFLLDVLKAALLGLVEGLTEFLPISSTGHLVLAGDALDFSGPVAAPFLIFIQLGAVLAVVWHFRADLAARLRRLPTSPTDRRLALNLVVAFLPAALVGLAWGDLIEAHLLAPVPVALAQIAGALLIFWAERRNTRADTFDLDGVRPRQALGIGLAQVLALWPGASRAASTIIGGMLTGLDRPTATGFSFYLAIPTLGAASVYSLAKHAGGLTASDVVLLAVGFLTSFLAALVVIRWLLRYVAQHSLAVFAWYRVALGVAVLLWVALGR